MSRFLQQNFRKTKQLGISRIIVTVMRYIHFFFLHLIFNKVVIQNRTDVAITVTYLVLFGRWKKAGKYVCGPAYKI